MIEIQHWPLWLKSTIEHSEHTMRFGMRTPISETERSEYKVRELHLCTTPALKEDFHDHLLKERFDCCLSKVNDMDKGILFSKPFRADGTISTECFVIHTLESMDGVKEKEDEGVRC